jgi:hypothetical protein
MNFIRILLSLFLVVLLASSAAGQGKTGIPLRRTLHGQTGSAGATAQKPGNTVVFDFTSYGGAAAYLATLDTTKLQQLLSNAGWKHGKGQLAKLLDDDPTFVSPLSVFDLQYAYCTTHSRKVLITTLDQH